MHDSKEVQEISAEDGEELQVDCVMVPSFPLESNVTWTHPSMTNSSTSWTPDRSSYSLAIPNLRQRDSGDYKCEVDISDKVIEKRIEIKGRSILAEGLWCIFTHPTISSLQCNKPSLQWLSRIQES